MLEKFNSMKDQFYKNNKIPAVFFFHGLQKQTNRHQTAAHAQGTREKQQPPPRDRHQREAKFQGHAHPSKKHQYLNSLCYALIINLILRH